MRHQRHDSRVQASAWAPRRAERRRERGFTLLEVTLAILLVSAAFVGVMSATASSVRLSQTTVDTQAALGETRAQITAMRATPFAEALAAWQSRGFDVAGLQKIPGAANHGTIRFLTESEASSYWKTSLDLDGDGVAAESEAAHAGFELHCVRFRVQWRDGASDRTIEIHAMIYDPEG